MGTYLTYLEVQIPNW